MIDLDHFLAFEWNGMDTLFPVGRSMVFCECKDRPFAMCGWNRNRIRHLFDFEWKICQLYCLLVDNQSAAQSLILSGVLLFRGVGADLIVSDQKAGYLGIFVRTKTS